VNKKQLKRKEKSSQQTHSQRTKYHVFKGKKVKMEECAQVKKTKMAAGVGTDRSAGFLFIHLQQQTEESSPMTKIIPPIPAGWRSGDCVGSAAFRRINESITLKAFCFESFEPISA
jgi:hypothetical protein